MLSMQGFYFQELLKELELDLTVFSVRSYFLSSQQEICQRSLEHVNNSLNRKNKDIKHMLPVFRSRERGDYTWDKVLWEELYQKRESGYTVTEEGEGSTALADVIK